MSLSLFKSFASQMTDYIARHNSNYSAIEAAVNALEATLGSATQGLAVPLGLREIFDRKGIIGRDSYDFEEGPLTGPDYLLTINPGAWWNGGEFCHKLTSSQISMAGKSTGTYYVNIDSAGNPQVSSSTDSSKTTRSFYWNATTHQISAKEIYAGVSILFDGDDYQDCLTSEERSKTFTRLADRLEDIEGSLGAMMEYLARDPATTTGLTWGYKAGKVRNDNTIWEVSAGTLTLTANATNYIEVNPADGTVSANTTGFTAGRIPLYVAVTGGSSITGYTDKRTWAIVGGGGGGHAQNTDVGTTSPEFKLNMDEVGEPTEDCYLKVERGVQADVALRWNEALDKWQYSNDGTVWKDLGEADLSLGAQELSKYVPKENPDLVYEELNRGSSTDYEDLALASYVNAPLGVSAVVLRVFFWDSSPGSGINVKFKKGNSPFAPAQAFTAWEDDTDPVTLVLPVDEEVKAQFYVTASGSGTANLRVFLLGYFAKVTGVGTQEKTYTQTGLNVPANNSQQFNLTAFLNRGLAHYLKVEETGGLVTGTYDVEIYEEDTFTTLLYKAEGIIPTTPYEDWLPFWLKDADGTRELHLKIDNNDLSQQGTYKITLKTEMFD
jgi:hypothetical protein